MRVEQPWIRRLDLRRTPPPPARELSHIERQLQLTAARKYVPQADIGVALVPSGRARIGNSDEHRPLTRVHRDPEFLPGLAACRGRGFVAWLDMSARRQPESGQPVIHEEEAPVAGIS